VRGLVCTARGAEDGGRFDEAASAWRGLGDHEQVLRCRVAHLEGAGQLREVAALLESKQRYEVAAGRWRRAGDLQAAARCEALQHEKKGRLEEAGALWASLGEPAREARCRAILHFRRHEYEEAARHYDRAGNTDMAVTARLLAAEARELAATHGRGQKRARRPRDGAAQDSLFASTPDPDQTGGEATEERTRVTKLEAPGEGTGATTAQPTAAAVLAAVRHHPGLTCESIAELTRMTTGQVKPVLAALTASRLLVKTGRTRGTRYSPA
jgi:hypothetical protein